LAGVEVIAVIARRADVIDGLSRKIITRLVARRAGVNVGDRSKCAVLAES
jgi:hypothetical protein